MRLLMSSRSAAPVRGALVGGVVLATALFVAGCSSGDDSSSAASSAAESAETTTAAATSTIAGQDGADEGGSTSVDVPVGACVNLSGTIMNAEVVEAPCGSMESNYRVASKVEQNENCPGDADQVYYETLNGVEMGALCLDTDWVVGGCMSVPMMQPATRVDCADPAATSVERVTAILENTSSAQECATSGYEYTERNFVVCTESVV